MKLVCLGGVGGLCGVEFVDKCMKQEVTDVCW